MGVKLAAASGGSIELVPTNTASAFTVTVPAVTGTMALQNGAGVGKVLQVVNAVVTASQSTSSGSYVDVTGLTVSITPSSSSSKILVAVSLNNVSQSTGNLAFFNLLRNATTITYSSAGGAATTAQAWASGGGAVTDSARQISNPSLQYLDAPATTSALTYKVQMKTNGAGTAYVNQWATNTDVASVSTITVMEIAA